MKDINGNYDFVFMRDSFYDDFMFDDVIVEYDHYDGIFKPYGGLWLSPYISQGYGYVSDWQNFVEDKLPYKDISHCTVFSIKDDANVLILDDPFEFTRNYPLLVTPLIPDSPSLVLCNVKFDKIVEYGYDAFYLSDEALEWTNPYSTDSPIRLFGWDVESLFVINKDVLIEKDRFIL